MKALILVDIQNDFLPGGRLPVKDGDTIIPVVNDLIPRYPLVAATQDWHPPGHHSFASSHPGARPLETIEIDGNEQTLWPDHCVWDTEGAAFAPALRLDRARAIFRKGMDPKVDSYSGFFDNHRLYKTGLAEWLQAMGVDEVHIAGLAAEICVAYTARDAAELGFKTAIVEDGTFPLSQQAFAKDAAELIAGGIRIAPGAELAPH